MATKAKAAEQVITPDVLSEEHAIKEISLMPNWENTATWLHICSQIVMQKGKSPSPSALLKKVDNAKMDSEKFKLLDTFAVSEVMRLNKRIESLTSVAEIARYEISICLKKEG